MRVLHIAGGFAMHPLYDQLVRHLRELNLQQTIFAPVRSAAEERRQPSDERPELEYKFRNILNPAHRVFFRYKITKIYSELLKSIDPYQLNLAHAHTTYSDGAVALRLHRQFGIPFVVAVRNTDLNIFMRFRPDLRNQLHSVVREASRVVFLSPAYRSEFLSQLTESLRAMVQKKAVVLGNGIDAFWLENYPIQERDTSKPLGVLYVGDFSRNKNVESILRATAVVAKRMPVRLTLVGGGGSRDRHVRELIDKGQYPFTKFVGRVNDRYRLREIYREHDVFVMPSFKESFGVVYLEALSQGLPIVHSHGQGVDGFFAPHTVAEATNPHKIASIAASIESLAARRDRVRPICHHEAKKFSWDTIAFRYVELYNSSSSGNATT
jgi:glycosyltransferase involved in cell wall biosynthesis